MSLAGAFHTYTHTQRKKPGVQARRLGLGSKFQSCPWSDGRYRRGVMTVEIVLRYDEKLMFCLFVSTSWESSSATFREDSANPTPSKPGAGKTSGRVDHQQHQRQRQQQHHCRHQPYHQPQHHLQYLQCQKFRVKVHGELEARGVSKRSSDQRISYFFPEFDAFCFFVSISGSKSESAQCPRCTSALCRHYP